MLYFRAIMNIYDIEATKILLEKQPKISIIPHKNPDGALPLSQVASL